jgi:steroid delta-isomerase-like uncharacterized protein
MVKIKAFLFVFGPLLLASATTPVFAQSDQLIAIHFKALKEHQIDAIKASYADDAKVYSPNWEGAKTGQAGITEIYSRYFSSTPDLDYTLTNTITAGDQVIVEYTFSGTLSNPEASSPAYMKGRKYTLNCCAIFTIANGKITLEKDYFDQVAFLRQVGFFDQQ